MQFGDTYFEAYSDGSQSFKIIVIPICDPGWVSDNNIVIVIPICDPGWSIRR